MKACCLEGSVHKGTPVGRVEKLHGLDCYITEPEDAAAPKALIVYFPDAFGWSMVNNRLLADTYARRTGARVYLPEFMDGNGFPQETMSLLLQLMEPSPGYVSMLYNKTVPFLRAMSYALPRLRGLSDGPCRPRILSFLTALRANEGQNLKIGAAGFCWGGHHIVDLCSGITSPDSDGQTLIDAGFSAHPSNVSVPVDFEKVKLPLSISIGDIDFGLSVEKCREAQKVLAEKGDDEKYEFRILPGAKHGFALRHSQDSEEEVRLAGEAEDQAVAFWARWIGTKPL